MEIRNLTCIGCPLGCSIHVTLSDTGEIEKIDGHTCKLGVAYAHKEVTNPTRVVTSTVRVVGAAPGIVTVSCKTQSDVPKSKIFDIMKDIKDVTVSAPVHIGDVIKANAADTGVDIVATCEIS